MLQDNSLKNLPSTGPKASLVPQSFVQGIIKQIMWQTISEALYKYDTHIFFLYCFE